MNKRTQNWKTHKYKEQTGAARGERDGVGGRGEVGGGGEAGGGERNDKIDEGD